MADTSKDFTGTSIGYGNLIILLDLPDTTMAGVPKWVERWFENSLQYYGLMVMSAKDHSSS